MRYPLSHAGCDHAGLWRQSADSFTTEARRHGGAIEHGITNGHERKSDLISAKIAKWPRAPRMEKLDFLLGNYSRLHQRRLVSICTDWRLPVSMEDRMNNVNPSNLSDSCKPRLAPGVRMVTDRMTGQPLLVFPEAMVELKGPGQTILALCDGRRSLADVVAMLAQQYNAPVAVLQADVIRYLDRLRDRRLVEVDGPENPLAISGAISIAPQRSSLPIPATSPRPLGLI